MARQSLSTLRTKANLIKAESAQSANTALRVGGFGLDLTDSAIQEFDASATYVQNQIVVFDGALAQAASATTAGQSPLTHPLLWSRKIVLTSAGIALGNFNPVSANALAEFVDEGGFGEGDTSSVSILPATLEEVDEGVRDDVYIAPDVNKQYLTDLLDRLGLGKTLLQLAQSASLITTEHPVNDIPAIKALIGCCDGTTTGDNTATSLTLSATDLDELTRFFYVNMAFLAENRTGVPPTLPHLTGTPVVARSPAINNNLSRIDPLVGLIIQANCSFGENFRGRVYGRNGANVPDQTFKELLRIDGTITNGTYAYTYGILPPGDYTVDIIIGVDVRTAKSLDITVAATVPIPLDEFDIQGDFSPLESVSGAQFTCVRKWTDNVWRPYLGSNTFVLTVAPTGLGIGGNGIMTGGANIITKNEPFTLRCDLGFRYIERSGVLINTVGGSVPAPTTQIINHVSREVTSNGRIGLANVTAAVDDSLGIYKLVNSVEVLYSQSAWIAASLLTGEAYGSGGATVQVVWGFNTPTEAGTYIFREKWRPAGSTDTSQYVLLAPYTVQVGSTSHVTTPWGPDPNYVDPFISAVDWKWLRATQANPDASNRIYLYIKTAGQTPDSVRVGFSVDGTRANSTAYALTSDAQGYQFGFDLNFYIGANITFYFMPIKGGVNYAEVSKTLIVPNSQTTSRAGLYP